MDRYHLALDVYVEGNYEDGFIYVSLNFITFWILTSYMVPISLFVTMEIVKFWQVPIALYRHRQDWSAPVCSL